MYDYESYYAEDLNSSSYIETIYKFMMMYSVILMVVGIVVLVAMYKLFKKCGKPGWAAIIPIYNMWVLLQIGDLPGWLSLIPGVNVICVLIAYANIGKKFNKSTAFILGLIFLTPIFLCILAFGKDKPDKESENQTVETSDVPKIMQQYINNNEVSIPVATDEIPKPITINGTTSNVIPIQNVKDEEEEILPEIQISDNAVSPVPQSQNIEINNIKSDIIDIKPEIYEGIDETNSIKEEKEPQFIVPPEKITENVPLSGNIDSSQNFQIPTDIFSSPAPVIENTNVEPTTTFSIPDSTTQPVEEIPTIEMPNDTLDQNKEIKTVMPINEFNTSDISEISNKVEENQTSDSSVPKICPKCGAPLSENAQICFMCGEKF